MKERKDRTEHMIQQMNDFGFEFTIFEAYTPSNSQEYLKETLCAVPEMNQAAAACVRSHAQVLYNFGSENQNDDDLLVVLEDDVALHKNFQGLTSEAVGLMKKHNLDFISLGYIPRPYCRDLSKSQPGFSDGTLKWFGSLHAGKNNFSEVWGSQAYCVLRKNARKMSKILFQPSFQAYINECNQRNEELGNNPLQVFHVDQVCPRLFSQGFCDPPIAIERKTASSIGNDFVQGLFKRAAADNYIVSSDFYKNPWPGSCQNRIGITVHKLDLFSNGAIQNCYFMYKCLEASGLAVSYLAEEKEPFVFCDKQVVKMDHTFPFDEFSHVITVTRIPCESFQESLKAAGIQIIKYICGNNFMFLMEDFALRNCALTGSADEDSQIMTLCNLKHVDQIWAFDGLRDQKFMLETLTKLPVRIVPHLWNSDIVLKNGMPKAPMNQYRGGAFHILIAESNYSTFKCAFVPLVAAEAVFNTKPESIKAVHILAFPQAKKPAQITNVLQISKLGKLYKYGRLPLPEALRGIPKHCPLIIVSHCSFNPLNYMHYELLEFGYALVHNSVFLKDYGYYYPENDIGACTQQIFRAMLEHTEEKAQLTQMRFKNFARSIDPNSENVQQEYKSLLESRISLLPTVHQCHQITCTMLGNDTPQGLIRRKAFFTQLNNSDFQFPFQFKNGFTPSSVAVQKFLHNSNCSSDPRVISLVLGNISILKDFVTNDMSEYLLVLEDDVALANNFCERLNAAIKTWSTDGILRVGYMPINESNYLELSKDGFKSPWATEKCKEFFTGFQNDSIRSGVSFLNVGAQAVLYTRNAAMKLLQILDVPSFEGLQMLLEQMGPYPFGKYPWPIAWDHLLYLPCGSMSFVHPPLAIENDMSGSSIGSDSSIMRWGHASANGHLDETNYYGSPKWKEAYLKLKNT